jgi:transposase
VPSTGLPALIRTTRRKKRRDWLRQTAAQHEDWLLVEEDECWFSRFAQPQAHAWAAHDEALRLYQREARRDEVDKALACCGAVRQDTDEVLLYFSDGQPNSLQQWMFIVALLAVARAEGKRVVAIIWDNASWHKSKDIRAWIRAYNRAANAEGHPRLLTHLLPTKSPWLNPIEPRWVHAKRGTLEPKEDLTPMELRRRLCLHFQTLPLFNAFNLSALNLH